MSQNKRRIIVFIIFILLTIMGGIYTRNNLEIGIAIIGMGAMVGLASMIIISAKNVLDVKESQLQNAKAETTTLQMQTKELKSQTGDLKSQLKIAKKKSQTQEKEYKFKKETRETRYTRDDKEAAQWIFEGMKPREAFDKKRDVYVLPEIEEAKRQSREEGVEFTNLDEKDIDAKMYERFRKRVDARIKGKSSLENNNLRSGK